VESSCECGDEPLGFIKFQETIKELHNWWSLEQCSAAAVGVTWSLT
jgi:hypothetical protein